MAYTPVVFICVLICEIFHSSADDIKLKQLIKPTFYHLKLTPNIEGGTFQGKVSIDLTVGDEFYSDITLHGHKDITFEKENVTLWDDESQEIVVHNITRKKDDIIVISLEDQIFSGYYKLLIDYNGKVRDDMTGFYRSYYFYNKKKRWLGATQFEPIYARRAFPCFDEPGFRSNFSLEINNVSSETHGVLSNVKASKTEKDSVYFDGFKTMPTYLLAWLVFEKDSFVGMPLNKPATLSGTELKVWTQADYRLQTVQANEEASKLLSAFEKYLNIPYSLNKMDQVAVPDFKSGAMENWGLVTYRENIIIFDENISTSEDLQALTMVIAHEFTHQWFGNLVTLSWWSYTWLNEGFARFFQYFILDRVHPDWKVEEQFVVMALQPTLEYDSYVKHPMSSKISNSSTIFEMFDKISYSKGASVIRMMEHILTPEIFQAAIGKYLSTVSKRNPPTSKSKDLFKMLSLKKYVPQNLPSNFQFETIMRSWTDQSGYPVITVTRNKNSFTISQKRGLYNNKNNDSDKLWYIPLTYTTKSEADFSVPVIRNWLTTKNTTLNITVKSNDWIIFNIRQKGFYRVNYDNLTWNLIIMQLKQDHSKIHPINRAQLISDAFFFQRTGLLDSQTLLHLCEYLSNELDYAPWISAVHGFKSLMDLFSAEKVVHDLLQSYMSKLMSEVVRDVGYEVNKNEEFNKKLKRIKILNFAARLGHVEAKNRSLEIVKDLFENNMTSYAPDVQKALLCSGIKYTSVTQWEKIFSLYEESLYPTQKLLFLNALACTENTELLKKLVDFIVFPQDSTPKIRRQDVTYVFDQISSTPVGAKFMLNYVVKNFKELSAYNFNESKIISDIISSGYKRIFDKNDVVKIEDFAKNNTSLSHETLKKINSTLTKLKSRIDSVSVQKKVFEKWLTDFQNGETSDYFNATVTAALNPTDETSFPSTGSSNTYNVVIITSVMELLVLFIFC